MLTVTIQTSYYKNPRLLAYTRAAEALAEGAAPCRRAIAILVNVAERGDATATIACCVVRGGGRMDDELGRAMRGRKMLGFCALGQKMAADTGEENGGGASELGSKEKLVGT
ncbi:hypothetical protein B0H17DRAFT_1126427 [Mycena rosella]|uniref:Uncharacterized protein n=1 Tax=Mycena rosella TaxID=1033263 RepID=A0AAD7GT82_MYCRO|nr:hypothetical protein B0H17DRAFT_1126427 [Mycena rosella]